MGAPPLGRPCGAPGGVNLHVSVLFRPGCHSREAARFSLIAPLALCDALEDLGLSPALEWPNEVLVARITARRESQRYGTAQECRSAQSRRRHAAGARLSGAHRRP